MLPSYHDDELRENKCRKIDLHMMMYLCVCVCQCVCVSVCVCEHNARTQRSNTTYTLSLQSEVRTHSNLQSHDTHVLGDSHENIVRKYTHYRVRDTFYMRTSQHVSCKFDT